MCDVTVPQAIDVHDALEYIASLGYLWIDTKTPDFAPIFRFLDANRFIYENTTNGVTPKLIAFFEKSNYTCVKMADFSEQIYSGSTLHFTDIFSHVVVFFSVLFLFMCYKIIDILYKIQQARGKPQKLKLI